MRSPTTIYSYVCSIALGSTLSRIITQPDLNLVRGILSLAIIVRQLFGLCQRKTSG